MGYNNEQFRTLRDAISDGLTPEQMLEVFNFDTLRLLDTLDNDDIVEKLDILRDYIPSYFGQDIDDTDGEDA